jgi:cytochrome c-type biogenesis protein CcmE
MLKGPIRPPPKDFRQRDPTIVLVVIVIALAAAVMLVALSRYG